MHFFSFNGMVPKVHPKMRGEKYSDLAQDMDIYGGRFQPLPELGESVAVVDVYGTPYFGVPETIHYSEGVYVGFDYFTTVAPDYTNRLGEGSFFFIGKDKRLYRQSPRRVAQNKPPKLVGIDKPSFCDTHIKAESLSGQGCETEEISLLCVPAYDRDCGDRVPVNTAFCFTYVNSCGEESQPSPPSNHIEFYDGDAMKLTISDKPPENATKRRWYMLIADSDGVGRWLYIGEHSVTQTVYYNPSCLMSIGEELDTEADGPPPTCVTGVVAVGNNQIALWQGRSLYFSQRNRQHAFDPSQEYRVLYDILRVEEVTDPMEQRVHHTMLVLTKGLHYIVGTMEDAVNFSELETEAPPYNAQAVCVAEKVMFFVSPRGLYEFSTGGVKLVTGQFFTEREWREYADGNTRLAFRNDRIHGVGTKNWIINFSEDDRRDASFVLTTENSKNVYSSVVGGLVFAMNKAEERPAELRKWAEDTPNRCAVWRSSPMVMAGLWRPVTVKVVSPHFGKMSAGAEEAMYAFRNFKKRNCNVTAEQYVDLFPEYRSYYSELSGQRPSVDVIIYADGREYYRRRVFTNKPFLLPRKYRAIDWSVEVRSRIPIDEVHVQTSRETLLEQG